MELLETATYGIFDNVTITDTAGSNGASAAFKAFYRYPQLTAHLWHMSNEISSREVEPWKMWREASLPMYLLQNNCCRHVCLLQGHQISHEPAGAGKNFQNTRHVKSDSNLIQVVTIAMQMMVALSPLPKHNQSVRDSTRQKDVF